MKTWLLFFAASTSILGLAACGARSGLPYDERAAAVADAGPDADADAGPNVVVPDCQDAGISYIYLISSENELLRFYPPDLSLTTIGTIDCPTASSGATPFSMAVDRKGVAHVLFNDGELFRVSTLTASCKATGFVGQQNGFPLLFGMGFSANKGDPGETLFVSGNNSDDIGSQNRLGRIDLTTFELFDVGILSESLRSPELTGTGDSRLFGFSPGVPDSHLVEIDKTTAVISSDVVFDLKQDPIIAWAFAFWGGDFYVFTSASQGSSVVHRYTPGGVTSPPVVSVIGLTIVGAGVSTCAPSE